ncbi:MAG: phospho-N-acetylmuramoyl-pentapeptide-transferase [Thermacetogenium sp.]|nr:phospho-N-acetylmuramoyl-pentapeptide-transferase [Thermacetogenium sp.]
MSAVKMSILAGGIGLATVLLLGPLVIPLLYRLKFGQEIRDDGPRAHLKKRGTATMGGIMILAGTALASFLVNGASPENLFLFAVMLGCGLLGFADDYLKIVFRRPLGLRARAKMLGLLIVGAFLAWSAFILQRGTLIAIPFTELKIQVGLFYYLFVVLVLIATANAVNLTDGLDGLAGGLTAIVGIAYVVISLLTGHEAAAVFAAAVAGSCLGFLKFNHYPASVFMGDTGSLALGGALAGLAVLTASELTLVILGGVFVLEVISVVIQVISFQMTGKRVFRMSPLHHHFELSGWPEVRVVSFFWFIGCCLAVLGILSLRGMG